MSIVLDAVLEANRKYAETFGSKSELPIPPGRKFAIVTCMDARLDPAKFAGLAEGDAQTRDDLIYLEKLPVFNPDGSVKE